MQLLMSGCLQGWTGTHCLSEIDECACDPCQNGGLCYNTLNGYECRCSRGTTGMLQLILAVLVVGI